MLIALNKPYGVLSQFTPEPSSSWGTLADLRPELPKNVYPIGRLDADSEGLLLLSDEKTLVDRLLNPRHAHVREYTVQIERIPSLESLQKLMSGVVIGGQRTLPARAALLDTAPERQPFPPRVPPIRERKSVPDCWITLELTEGKNRQVRRMTAAIGHPTLRLVRTRIGRLALGSLALLPGQWRELSEAERRQVLG